MCILVVLSLNHKWRLTVLFLFHNFMGPSVLMPLNLDFFFSNAVQTNWSFNFYLEWLVLCKFIYIYYLVQKMKE